MIFVALLIGCGALFLSKDLTPLGLTLLVFVLIFAGMPIAFALGLLGLMGFALTFGGGPMLAQVPMVTYKILDDFIIVAVPLFLMLSAILSIGRIGFHLFEFASTWVRHLPGGLGVATIFACAIFAAMCGSSVATVATIGLIAIPEMLSRGYKRELVFGTVAIGGVLGPLIPPSIYMILIGAITGDSVGKLFMAGMLPGILLAVIFSALHRHSFHERQNTPTGRTFHVEGTMGSDQNGFPGAPGADHCPGRNLYGCFYSQ